LRWVRRAELIDWQRFEASFGELYDDGDGAPGRPTRLLVGLYLIKHMEGSRTRRFMPPAQPHRAHIRAPQGLALHRSIATRFDRKGKTFPAAITLAATVIWWL